MNSNRIDVSKYKLVIFDIDGTLYDQKKLRVKMLLDIFFYYLFRPFKIYELTILKAFREEREKKKGYKAENLENEQYLWTEEKTKYSKEIVKNVISKWIFIRPLKYLIMCRYRSIEDLFIFIRKKRIKIGIYSDYPTKKKWNI